MRSSTPTVLIVQRIVPQYRVPFFDQLKTRLEKEGVMLEFAHGQPDPEELAKQDSKEVPWAHRFTNRSIGVPLSRKRMVWQPCLKFAARADLVIVEQASRFLLNYVLLAAQKTGLKRMAFWGLGYDVILEDASAVGEWIKRGVITWPHWWFAYNDAAARVVRKAGFPDERITVVENAINTRELVELRAKVTPEALVQLREALGIRSQNVGIYCGRMYSKRRLEFLLRACERIKQRVPDFELLMLGGGPDQHLAQEAVKRHAWIRYLGPSFGEEKVKAFALAKVYLMPGIVGLGIVDSFAMGVPLVTTAIPYHSVEVDYLRPGENGVMVQDYESEDSYAEAAIRLLTNDAELDLLRAGCERARRRYTLENMVENFAGGILSALREPRQ